MPTPAGFTALIAARIQDALGNLQSGTLVIEPTDAKDVPIFPTAGGVGGPVATAGTATFSAGALATGTCVPDTALTSPANISYRFTFKDSGGNTFRVWTGVQPTGAQLNLDTYVPNLPAQAPYTPGPAGAKGDPGLVGASLSSQSFTVPASGSSATFTLAHTPLFLWVFLNGSRQPGTTSTGTSITVNGTLTSGDTIDVDYLY